MASLLKTHQPESFAALSNLAKVVMKDGALSAQTKELMAIALSIAANCEPCVKIHTRRALQLGASAAQISETVGVAVLMLGGPADVWPVEIIEEEIARSAAKEENQKKIEK